MCLFFASSLFGAEKNIVNVSHRVDTAHKAMSILEALKNSKDPQDLAQARSFFEDLSPDLKCSFYCQLYKISGSKADASAAFKAAQAIDNPCQKSLSLAFLWQTTGNAKCLQLARENAAGIEKLPPDVQKFFPCSRAYAFLHIYRVTNDPDDLARAREYAAIVDNFKKIPQGAKSFFPCERAYTFLAIYQVSKDANDLAQAREYASPSFSLQIYRTTRDTADLAQVMSNVKESQSAIVNVWWLLQLYSISKDQQYVAKAREFAQKHGSNNRDYTLPFLEIYKVTKDPQDLASARESRGDAQFLIKIYEVSQDPQDLASAREVAAKAPNPEEAIWSFIIIWIRTHQSQDLDGARSFVRNIPHYLSIYKAAGDPQDLASARKFAAGIKEPFEKVCGFLEIYRFTKDPQDIASAKKFIATVKDKDKRAVAAEMVKRAIQTQAPNKELKERYASS